MTTATIAPPETRQVAKPDARALTRIIQYSSVIAQEASSHAASAATQALDAANTGEEFWRRSKEASQAAVFQPMRRYASVSGCRQQAKANILEASALSCRPLARSAAHIARRFSLIASTAADNAAAAAANLPTDSCWNDLRDHADAAQDNAAEALRNAIQARGHADRLRDLLEPRHS